ncbi:MAG: tetratricopeptide repeat protein [Phycisphaerales bacterium]|nr:tetratricopeptide repeat protein [Phycisphaerales bacterium]
MTIIPRVALVALVAALGAAMIGCGGPSHDAPPAASDAAITTADVVDPDGMPPLSFTTRADGSREAQIDHGAFVAFCRAHGLPDPPDVHDVDAAAMEAIHGAVVAIVAERSVSNLTRLAIIYDGNAVLTAAEPLYRELREHDATSFAYLGLHGRCLAKLGRHEEAVVALAGAAALRPDQAAVQYRLGESRLELGDLDGADAAFAQYAALRPEDGLGPFGLGRVGAARSDWGSAATHLDAAVAIAPDLKGAWLLLAQVRQRLGEDEAARLAAARASAIPGRGYVSVPDPMESEMYLASGSTAALESHLVALAGAGRYAEAYAVGETLRQRRPRDPLVLKNLASLARGQSRLDLALTHAEALVALDDGDGTSHTLRAVILRDLTRYDDAIAAADAALGADRPDGTAHLVRATSLIRFGRGDEALAACDAAAAFMPDSLDPLVTRAGILMALRRSDEARLVLDEILMRDPTHAWARGALESLSPASTPGG